MYSIIKLDTFARQSSESHTCFDLVFRKMFFICHARGHWKSFAWPCFCTGNSLSDARMSASEKVLPVLWVVNNVAP